MPAPHLEAGDEDSAGALELNDADFEDDVDGFSDGDGDEDERLMLEIERKLWPEMLELGTEEVSLLGASTDEVKTLNIGDNEELSDYE